MNTTPATENAKQRTRSPLWPKVLLYFVIIGAWYSLSRFLPLDQWVVGVLGWIEELGFWGPVVFVGLYIPCCVLLLPDVLANAAAGAIWGVGLAAVVVSLGRGLGSAATFLLARGVAGAWIEQKMRSDLRFAALSEAIGREGFKIVVLLRLCPLFPTIMLNYALGLTRVSLPAYAAGTLIGMIPRTLFVAYAGSGVRSLADLVRGEAVAQPGHPLVYWGGLVFSLVIAVLLTIKARQMLHEAAAVAE